MIDDPEYWARIRERREHLDRLWKSQDGGPSATSRTREHIISELEAGGADYPAAMRIAAQWEEWTVDRNSARLGYALTLCDQIGLEPGPTLLAECAMLLRLQYAGLRDAGQPTKLLKADAKAFALWLMAHLIISGDTDATAASKAARELADRNGGKSPFKASSLEKWYPEEYRRSFGGKSHEQRLREWRGERKANEAWAEIRDRYPLADDEQIGARR